MISNAVLFLIVRCFSFARNESANPLYPDLKVIAVMFASFRKLLPLLQANINPYKQAIPVFLKTDLSDTLFVK